MHISYVADHPECIDTLVSWSLEQWRFVLPEEPPPTAKFQVHLNRDVLPIAWIARSEGEVFGMAALRAYHLEGRERLGSAESWSALGFAAAALELPCVAL